MPETEDERELDNPLVTGELRGTLFYLALPVLMEQFLSFFVGFFDTYLSGRISAEATNAVGLGAYVGWLAGMLFGLVGTGTTALVARHWGAGEFHDANRVMNRSIVLSVVMGLFVFFLVFGAAPFFVQMMDMKATTAALTVRYLRVDAVGHLFMGVSLIGAAALRGSGNTRTPMFVLGMVNVINMVSSAVLTFGIGPIPPLGVDGIVLGTVVARVAGGALMLFVLARGSRELHLSRREWKLGDDTVRRVLRIGGPAALDGTLGWIGQFLFLIIVNHSSAPDQRDAVYAAHVIGIRIEAITYLPAYAWGIAAAAMIGQSLGAGVLDRARRIGHEAVLQCSLLGLVIAILFFWQAEGIYRLMHTDSSVWAAGVPAFRLLAFFQVPLVWSIVYVQALRGAGDTRTPLWITLFGVLCVRLSLAYLFGVYWQGGLFGAWIGMCADVGIRAILVAICYVRGSWEKRVI
ncbi:MAG: MATE family efflux transporter [Planctomycetaceae bacterium]